MQKKLFLQKNLRPMGKHSYVKALLWCAIGLVLLFILTPLVTRQKGHEETLQKPPSERGGALVKEIPRPLESFPERLQEPDTAAKETDPRISAIPDMKSFPDGKETGQPEPQAGKLSEFDASTGASPPSEGKAVSPGQQKDFPADAALGPLEPPPAAQQKHSIAKADDAASAEKAASNKPDQAAPGSPAAQKKVATAASPAGKKQLKQSVKDDASVSSQSQTPGIPDVQKPGSAGGQTLFAVQVGSFKEKQNAEELQQSLQKRGYGVVIKPTMHPSLGQLYVVQLEPVADVSRASTQVAQIRQESKVKPVIIRVAPGQ